VQSNSVDLSVTDFKEDPEATVPDEVNPETARQLMAEAQRRELTPEQKGRMAQLRHAVNQVPEVAGHPFTEDHVLYRFLGARKWDVQKAKDMYLRCFFFRQENHCDEFLRKPPGRALKQFRQISPESFHKYDRLGRPLYIMNMGKVLVLQSQRINLYDLSVVNCYQMDRSYQIARHRTELLKREITDFSVLVDLNDLSMAHRHFLHSFNFLMTQNEAVYPETLGNTLIVNAPAIFPFFWKIVRPWFDDYTASKIAVVGRKNYAQTLLKFVDEDCLPVEYGGKCKCPGGCVPIIPEPDWAAYDAKRRQEAKQYFELKTITLKAAEIQYVEFKVDEKEMKEAIDRGDGRVGVEFYFESSKDIRYAVQFFPDSGAKKAAERSVDAKTFYSHLKANLPPHETLLPLYKVHSHEIPQWHEFYAFEPGTFKFRLDNYNSYFTSKTVTYGVKINRQLDMEVPEEFHDWWDNDSKTSQPSQQQREQQPAAQPPAPQEPQATATS